MNGQELPGFYWDAEKKKYFKIQSANASRDLNLKYSAQNIRKKEREDTIQAAANAHVQRTRKERIVRHHASTLSQICQERELGLKRRSYYLQSAWPNACASGVATKSATITKKSHGTPIRLFDRAPSSKTMYIVQGENSIKRRRVRPISEIPIRTRESVVEDIIDGSLSPDCSSFEPWDELLRTTSTVSSLTYLPTTGALAATTYGSDRPPVIYLTDPERDEPYVCQQFTPKGCATIWGAAARPTRFNHFPGMANTVAASHLEYLAVAASRAMLLFTRSSEGDWHANTPLPDLESDVLSIDWLSYTTIALGCRDGKIRIYDTRSDGSSHILTHSSPVSKIKRGDDQTRLIVSGLQDSLCLYDIRMSRKGPSSGTSRLDGDYRYYRRPECGKLPPGGRSHKKRRKIHELASRGWSQPVLTFTHSNMDDIGLDIDVHPRLGLVAACQERDSHTAIRISNIWTGQTVKEFSAGKGQGKQRARCIKFMDTGEDGEEVKLWVTGDGGILHYAW